MAIVNRGYGIGAAGINIVTAGYGKDLWFTFKREVIRLVSYISKTLNLESKI